MRDEAHRAFDVALASQHVQTRRAARDVRAVLVALFFGRFTECQRTRVRLRASAIIEPHEFESLSVITVRSIRIARQTRCRTASDVVPRIAAASCEE